jgi:serine/threonine protein kinase
MKTFFSRLAGSKATPIQHRESVQRIGDYSIVREIGAGATSNVFLGIHVKTLAAAAVKQLSPQFTSPSHRQMFATEASLCGKMSHPNIVDMYGADMNAADSPYLVMEYINGSSLDKFDTPDTLLPIETVIDVMRQSAEALAYASRLGIIHRDVKPGNIIIRKDGRVKIADFGCAITSEPNKSVVAIAGSLPYMSPEQLEGKPLDHQSDIYSLGVVFYRLLTGHYPFAMGDDQTARTYARKILNTKHAPIATHRKDVPAGIAAFVDSALQKKPEKRLGSWDEFLEQLHRASQEKYAENERLNISWKSFEIHQEQMVEPRIHDLSFSM